jgi:hypothetical protein
MEWCSILKIVILHARIEAMLLFVLRKTETGYSLRHHKLNKGSAYAKEPEITAAMIFTSNRKSFWQHLVQFGPL